MKDDNMRTGLQDVHKSPQFEIRNNDCRLEVQIPPSYPIEEIEINSLNDSTDMADSGTNHKARFFYLDNQVTQLALFFFIRFLSCHPN